MFAFPASAAAYLQVCGTPLSAGLWPVLMAQITVHVLADPTGSSKFLCFTLPNRAFPWFLVALFSLLGGGLQVDLLLGVLVGHASAYRLLVWMEPSARRISAWELGPSLVTRSGMTAHPSA